MQHSFKLLFLLAIAFQHCFSLTELRQKDFDEGTYIITQPGEYKLMEDISFYPFPAKRGHSVVSNGVLAGFPRKDQYVSQGGHLDDDAFVLGFFAAIVIQAKDVSINLNGHRIEQSAEHALLMRFFTIFSVADQPFMPNQGPANFGMELVGAENVKIYNGVIGRSSHHGIFGNGAKNVHIWNIHFVDYEVGAVALNGVQGLLVENCTAENRKDVPVLGTYSASIFILRYLNYLIDVKRSDVTLRVQGEVLSAKEVRSRLIKAIDNVYNDVVENGIIDKERHPDEYALYHNAFGVLDGNSYSFLTNRIGIAVNGFPYQSRKKTDPLMARDVTFRNVEVIDQRARINEIIAIRNAKGASVIDVVGSVFQTRNLHPDTLVPVTTFGFTVYTAIYKGNVIANAQALVGKAVMAGHFNQSGLDVTRNAIDEGLIHWIEEQFPMRVLHDEYKHDFFCNGDSMFHVDKGVIGFKIDATENALLENTRVTGIVNMGAAAIADCHTNDSHPLDTYLGYGGAAVRGYSFAGSVNVRVNGAVVVSIDSSNGPAYGFDVLTDSENIALRDVGMADAFVPNGYVAAVRFGQHSSDCSVDGVCADHLTTRRGNEHGVIDQGKSNSARRIESKCPFGY